MKYLLAPVLAFGVLMVGDATLYANKAGERRIAFYNIHTKDTVDVVYKRNGRRIPEAMKKINWVLRDWRQDEATRMDPALIDILWEMHTELGSRQPIHVISGYRSQKTNTMLRKTRGGQARKSRHLLGKAADVHFPDVPIKRLRYSAMIRERGGVGYYPTSAIPFVHVDTGRVRHWPRMPRSELALLFPNGKTRHRPPDNKPLRRTDVRIAKARNKRLAAEVASFHSFRRSPRAPRPTLVAENTFTPRNTGRISGSWGDLRITRGNAPVDAAVPPRRPQTDRRMTVAALDPNALQPGARQPSASLARAPEPAPQLLNAPRPVDRPTKLSPSSAAAERSRLTDLFTLASLFPVGDWFGAGDQPNTPSSGQNAATPRTSGPVEKRRLALVEEQPAEAFISAPAFDEEHPDELYYRPFAVAPLLTASASPDDPVLTTMVAPEPAQTLSMLDEDLSTLPMRFSPTRDVAAVMWNDHFTGRAVNFGFASRQPAGSGPKSRLASRPVRTTADERL
ncbi:MAG: DUF882 domain-containing protein [Pseudomonadota bacterium]